MTKLTELENIFMPMETNILVTGMRINKKELVLKSLLMVQFMKVFTKMERKKSEANSYGLTTLSLKEISTTISSMESEHTDGVMAEYTKVIGHTTKWKVLATSHGVMAETI